MSLVPFEDPSEYEDPITTADMTIAPKIRSSELGSHEEAALLRVEADSGQGIID
jgi:hypothetical protein